MSLIPSFSKAAKKIGIGICILSTLFLAACGYPSHRLGQDAGLTGATTIEQVYTGAGAEKVLTVDGSALHSQNRYTYNGTLHINGSVPEKTEIVVANGKLVVTGGVGNESEINVRLPVRTHDETTIILMPMSMPDGNGGSTTYLMPMPQTTTVEDGLVHPSDTGPAVQVDGAIGNKVTIRANHGIQAGAWGTEFKAKTGYGGTLQQVPAPQLPRTATAGAPAPGS